MYPDNSGTKINSVSLTTMGFALTGPISIGEAKASTAFINVPGMDGSIDLTLRNATGSAYLDRRTVTLSLATVGTKAEVAAARAAIGAYNGKDVYVYDKRFGGDWHGMLTLGPWSDHVESWNGQLSATVTATVTAEPALLLPEVSVTFSPTTQADSMFPVSISGNRPAWPVFTLTPNRSSNVIGVKVFDNNDGLLGVARYAQPVGAVISGTATVDCGLSVITIGGEMMPTSIMEDFPVLVPGTVKVNPIGCSGVTMTYRPRLML